MSDSTPPERWEEPTMELRQLVGEVRTAVLMGDGVTWRGTKTMAVVGVQQKWLVQDGESYPLPWMTAPRAPGDRKLYDGAHYDAFPWYAPVRAEWRDLPQIGAGEAEIVLR